MFILKKFESEQFKIIRLMLDEQTQEVVFNGNDVAKALGYTKAANAIRDYCRGVIDLVTPTKGGPQKMKYIPVTSQDDEKTVWKYSSTTWRSTRPAMSPSTPSGTRSSSVWIDTEPAGGH